uniref:ATP synthase complex subunit 8 n=1 Tax=Neocrepidodera transversa TaxID=877844 RepID=A0A3G1GNW4_9CUCU|nr:ATP synthase F0 subunit 8 [Neocrepidodera transversa]
MPQMMPLSWITLLFYFILIFLTFNILNYFSVAYSKNNISKKIMLKNYNWKW